MENGQVRTVYFYGDSFHKFYRELRPEVKNKFNWTFQLLERMDKVPERYFKYLKGSAGIYEVRVAYGTDIYRAFCFFDEGRLIVVLNGFRKKSQKTPKNEIALAERLKKLYQDEKEE